MPLQKTIAKQTFEDPLKVEGYRERYAKYVRIAVKRRRKCEEKERESEEEE